MMKHLLCLLVVVVATEGLLSGLLSQITSRIKQSLDKDVNPCDDFYQFACGGWEESNDIPPGSSEISATSKLQAENTDVVKNVLEDGSRKRRLLGVVDTITDVVGDLLHHHHPDPEEPEYVNTLKNFFSTCLDQDQDTQALQELRDIIDTGFGGWPMTTSNWNPFFKSLENAVLEASRHNVQTLCDFSVLALESNKSVNLLRANQPILFSLGYKVKYQVNRTDPSLLALEDRIVEVAKVFGNNVNETACREEAVLLVGFEQELASITFHRDEAGVHPWALYKWHLRYSTVFFNWKHFFYSATTNPEVGIYDLSLNELIYRGPDLFFLRLKILLATTPKRIVMNYIVWRVIDTYWDLVSTGIQQKRSARHLFHHHDDDDDDDEEETIEKSCLDSVVLEDDLKFASNRVYLDEKFSQEDKDMVSDMIPFLKEAAEELMDQLTWVDPGALQLTKDKLDHTQVRLGFPESRYTDTYLNNYYTGTSTSGTALQNTVASRREAWIKMVKSLRASNQQDDLWFFLPIHVNSYADVRTNSIEFPVALFQPPYFSGDNSQAMNYGALGSVIAYQFTGGYDSVGIQFDKDGNLGGWSAAQIATFNQQTQCLVNQYNGFVDKQVNKSVNGQRTLDANIADNAAVRQSFKAYRNWVATQGHEEASLPGLTYSPNQLFFIARAQLYCTLKTREQALADVNWDRFSPPRFRVNGPNQNSEDFAAAFNCPVNSNMNPANKCVVW